MCLSSWVAGDVATCAQGGSGGAGAACGDAPRGACAGRAHVRSATQRQLKCLSSSRHVGIGKVDLVMIIDKLQPDSENASTAPVSKVQWQLKLRPAGELCVKLQKFQSSSVTRASASDLVHGRGRGPGAMTHVPCRSYFKAVCVIWTTAAGPYPLPYWHDSGRLVNIAKSGKRARNILQL